MCKKRLQNWIFCTVLFIGLIGSFQNKLFAVEPVLSVNVRNRPLKEVVSQIEKQSQYVFIYKSSEVDVNRMVTINVNGVSIDKLLSQLFAGSDIAYKINNLQIILTKKTTTTPSQTKPRQERTISGTVSDKNGEPIIGANVIVKGAQAGTISDINGRFALPITESAETLVFSYIGMQTKEISVDEKSSISVTLEDASIAIDEVVVVGYGQQKKVSVTGAITQVSSEQLIKSPVATVSSALVGKIPGVISQQNSGEPGMDATTLSIRGIGTFTGVTSPLLLVDGVEVTTINNIDPTEVENISVLKDASATAVYGVRGGNGVIIVTTKRGSVSKPQVSLTSNFAVNSFTNFRNKVNAYEFANGYELAKQYESYVGGTAPIPVFSQEDLELYKNHKDPLLHPDVDWYGLLLKDNSYQTQNNINIRGGTENVKYFVSLGYFYQEGLYNNTYLQNDFFDLQAKYTRYNFRSNLDFTITKRLKMTVNFSAQMGQKNGGDNAVSGESTIRSFNLLNPITSPGLVDGKFVNMQASLGKLSAGVINPLLAFYQRGYSKNYDNTVSGSIKLSYDLDFITKGLSARLMSSYSGNNGQTLSYTKPILYYEAIKGATYSLENQDYSTIMYPVNQEGPFVSSESSSKYRDSYTEAGLDYYRIFGNHTFTGLFLVNFGRKYNPGWQFQLPYSYTGVVGRIAYEYKGKYMAEFNIGANGTDNFLTGHRFGVFPAYSLGWIVSEESFFPKSKLLNFLKIRGSYGEVGNDDLGNSKSSDRYPYLPSLYTNTTFQGNKSLLAYYFGTTGVDQSGWTGYYESKIGNELLTWEKAKKSNVGFELTMLNSMVRITADYFYENRSNIFTPLKSIPDIFGPTNILPSGNIGKMMNQGFEGEIALNAKIRKFHYWVKGNYTFARNKLLYTDEIYNPYSYLYRTGQSNGQAFGYIQSGLYNSWLDVTDAYRPKDTWTSNYLQPGDINVKDINGDGQVDQYDQAPIGYSNFPEIIYGFSFGGDYKGFDFMILFQGASNVSFPDLSAGLAAYTRRWDSSNAAPPKYIYNQSWSLEKYQNGDLITFPHLFTGGDTRNGYGGTLYQTDASYLRLKNAEIGYRFSLKQLGVSSARIYVNGNNLLTFINKEMRTTYPGVDPESIGAQSNYEPFPLTKTYNIGLNINF